MGEARPQDAHTGADLEGRRALSHYCRGYAEEDGTERVGEGEP